MRTFFYPKKFPHFLSSPTHTHRKIQQMKKCQFFFSLVGDRGLVEDGMKVMFGACNDVGLWVRMKCAELKGNSRQRRRWICVDRWFKGLLCALCTWRQGKRTYNHMMRTKLGYMTRCSSLCLLLTVIGMADGVEMHY